MRSLTNSHLSDDQLFIHYYIWLISFSAISKNDYKNKRDFIIKNDDKNKGEAVSKYRIYNDDNVTAQISSDFLSNSNEMLVYCYFLKKLNDKIKDNLIINENYQITITLSDIKEFLNKKGRFKEAHFENFTAYIDRFLNTKITLNLNDKTYKTSLISGAIITKRGKSKMTYDISFCDVLIQIYNHSKRHIIFEKSKFEELDTDGAKRLYLYLKSLSKNKKGHVITEFKKDTIKKVLGHQIIYITKETSSKVIESKHTNSKSNEMIRKYLDSLFKIGFIEKVDFKDDDKHIIIRKKEDFKDFELTDSQKKMISDLENSIIKEQKEQAEIDAIDDIDDLSDIEVEDIDFDV